MKSKSVVQERLEAGKNRLEVLSREVEFNRIAVPELSRGLRQVGTILEQAQRFVRTDTNVKFAPQINQKLEAGMTRLAGVIKLLDGTGITGTNLTENLKLVNRSLDAVQEFVDLEIEDLA
jgi:hypothetical protein